MFSSIPAEIRAALIAAGTVRTFRKGAVLWRRGGPAKWVFVILSGRIGLFDAMFNEGSAVIDLFSAGTLAGGGFPLNDPPYTYLFSGKALDELRVLTIPIAVYREHLNANHALLLATARHLLGG